MSDRALAEAIAEAVWVAFGPGDNEVKAGHLRLFTEAGKDGRYIAGWGFKPFVDRVEETIREFRVVSHD